VEIFLKADSCVHNYVTWESEVTDVKFVSLYGSSPWWKSSSWSHRHILSVSRYLNLPTTASMLLHLPPCGPRSSQTLPGKRKAVPLQA